MKVIDEIRKPTYSDKVDYSMTRTDNAEKYPFKCKYCDNELSVDFHRQINTQWIKTSEISDNELSHLRTYYGIGLSLKSHNGGQPVFDKVTCPKCKTTYYTYCGVTEFSNSAFNVTVHGIIAGVND